MPDGQPVEKIDPTAPAKPSADADSSGKWKTVFEQAKKTATDNLAQQFLDDLQSVVVGLASAGALVVVAGAISAEAAVVVGVALIAAGIAFGVADVLILLKDIAGSLNEVRKLSPCDEEALRAEGRKLGLLVDMAASAGTLTALAGSAVGKLGGGVSRFIRKAFGGEKSTVTLKSAGAAVNKSMTFTRSQLQSKFESHAEDFGIIGNPNNKTLAQFEEAILSHAADEGTLLIQGTYRNTQQVTHFFNPQTGINVMRDQDGAFISGWRLGKAQIENLLKHGNLQ